ncbi:unnamed protein product [Rotaria sordida]|uniref:Uncharacterized protein n=1 Tax=Rotaria sordida TaxID=392033 RepID=A0A815JF75_9BILA|nr:unnamed protein product [Rotaria sordida]CAF1378857.1 unnamed protein product [Rotaria sordida]CAF1431031.1 unnamed protein product [Rotaria sordida]CAF3797103.1 unnamed protein product [Rotaria sordida]CAF3832908.1 unnamed protein product [Rotaria sordida]
MPPLTDPNAPPATVGDKLKQNFSMFIEISKNRPISETLCLKEACMAAFLLTTNQLAELERQLDEIISKQQTERN